MVKKTKLPAKTNAQNTMGIEINTIRYSVSCIGIVEETK